MNDTRQERVEFVGGPKDGECIYSRRTFLSPKWQKPVLDVRLPSEPDEYYTYVLESGQYESRYVYQGVQVK